MEQSIEDTGLDTFESLSFELELLLWGDGQFSSLKTLKSSHEAAAVCMLGQPALSSPERWPHRFLRPLCLGGLVKRTESPGHTQFGSWQ